MSGNPFASHSDTNDGQRDEELGNFAQSSTANQSLNSTRAMPSTRRVQVLTACQPCRRRKRKCDALRPCTACRRSGITCQHETQQGETHSQALKRRLDGMAHSYSMYKELIRMLQEGSERDAMQLLRQIRSGHTPEAVIRIMEGDDADSSDPLSRRKALQSFLTSLAHSTGSLQAIVRLATLTLSQPENVHLPRPVEYLHLCNCIIHLSHVESLLRRAAPVDSGLSLARHGAAPNVWDGHVEYRRSGSRGASQDETYIDRDDTPLYRVPASPWTRICSNEDAMSHLISLFLAWINPTWLFVDKELFLRGMRSRRLDSPFCSPFLVNSICAIASLHSEHEIAFFGSDRDRITRGQHFHDEALRLWILEAGSPTLTNMQALCILGLESNYRAEDKLGLTLIPTAAQYNNELPLQADEQRCADQGVSKHDFEKARISTYWMVECTHVIVRVAFMSSTTAELESSVPLVTKNVEDEVEYWIGYPLATEAVAYRPALYHRERCKLAFIFQEIHGLFFTMSKRHKRSLRDLAKAVDSLSTKMQRWHRYLPLELQYVWPMSVAIWELHASYLAFLMMLFVVAKAEFQQEERVSNDEPPPSERDGKDSDLRSRKVGEYLSNAIPLAYRAAQILRDFRERYGLKITPAWLLQLQAVSAGVLILCPELAESRTAASPGPSELTGGIEDAHTAFDEVFRCLLGTGVEVMIARAIARMMYHTALERKIALTPSTRSMLQIMSDTAWRPSDLSRINSFFPNFATTKGSADRERMSELLSRSERLTI